ncbi:PAS domain S-box protein [Dactylosporangium sp. NPDC000555]|uniref:PAS domain S-box protein n=1 Tax=Dactylosporangium sp. NPDC000555 TaxID=3154260 RepID=UPI003328850B
MVGVRLQVLGVVLLGMLVSGGAGLLMHRVERDGAAQALDRRTAAAQDAVASAAQRYVDSLRLVAGALEALPALDAASFTTATQPLGQLWLPGAVSVDYVVPVPDAGVADAQAAWRTRGLPGLILTAAPGTGEHYFAVISRGLATAATGPPSVPGPGPGSGRDLAAVPQAAAAVERTRTTGLPAASEPYVQLRDAASAADPQPQTVALVQRVVERGTGALRGYLQLTVRVQDLFGDTMRQPARELLDVSLAAFAGTELRTIAAIHHGDPRGAGLRRNVDVRVADRQWQLRVAADGRALAGAGGHLDEGMFFGGAALTLVTALLVYTLATSRRRAEERVREATADLRIAGANARAQAALLGAVMDTIADGVAVIDGRDRAVWLNPTARAILGPDAAERPVSEWPELLDMREADGVTPYRSRHGGSGPETQVECLMAGRRVEVRLRALTRDGEPPGAVAVLRDITERHAADEQLRSSEELLQLLLDGARDYAIYMLDPEGCVVSWSGNAKRIKGYRSEEIIGESYARFFTPEDRAGGLPGRILRQAAEAGPVEIDGPRVRKDGTRFWAHGLLTAVRHPDGSVRGFVKVSQDVTARKKAELVIERLNADLERRVAERTADLREANAELESFSYSVSHDLRAPLRAVDGFAKMLALDYGDALDDRGRRYVGRIRAGAQQMGELIDGLLAFSRLQRQEMASRRVEFDQLVAEVWEELAVELGDRRIELLVGELPDALGDPRLVRHVVANLLGNAVKYTRDATPARIEVGHRVTAGGEATYFVRDNGAGFDMRYADKLFKVFQRLHRAEEYEGTGIGLALAHRIVHRHGGQIWADATPGEGATFLFTLPAYVPELEAVR